MEGSKPEVPDFKSLVPDHVNKALEKQEEYVSKYGAQVEKLRPQKADPVRRNRLMVPVIAEKQRHQRLAEQIRSEFDLPPKHILARDQLRNEEEQS